MHIVHKDGMKNLLEYRKAFGLTQRELADDVGVDQSVISRFERGQARPRLSVAVAIERATGGEVPASSWVAE